MIAKLIFHYNDREHTAVLDDDIKLGWQCQDNEARDMLNTFFPPRGFVTNGEPPGYTAARVAAHTLGGKLSLTPVRTDDVVIREK